MSSVGFFGARPAMQQTPNEDSVEETRKELKLAALNYVDMMEEGERRRRLMLANMNDSINQVLQEVERAGVKYKELEEKLDRIEDIVEWGKAKHEEKEIEEVALTTETRNRVVEEIQEHISAKEEREDTKAYVIIQEEQERARRIAEDSYKEEVLDEQRKDNKAYCIIQEEQERSRRIAEDSLVDEQELERRQLNKAYTVIEEEKERERRVSEDAYLDELEKEYSDMDRAYVTIMEEQERARRIADESYKDSLENELRFKNRKLTIQMEENERKRRIKKGITSKHRKELAGVALSAAEAASKMSEGQKLHAALFKKPRRRKTSYDYLEDKERRRRMEQRPSKEQLDTLRQVSHQASETAMSRLYSDIIPFAKEGKSLYTHDVMVQRKYFHDLEEVERQWRMAFPPSKEQLHSRRQFSNQIVEKSLVNKEEGEIDQFDTKYIDNLENIERKRRLMEKPSVSQLSHLRNISVVAARAAERKLSGTANPVHLYKMTRSPSEPREVQEVPTTESRASKLSELNSLEETERSYRIKNQLTGKQRLQLKVISNEAANVGSSRLLGKKRKSLSYKKPSAVRKDATRTMEEQERRRRMSSKPTSEQLNWLRLMAHLAAEQGAKSHPSQVPKSTIFLPKKVQVPQSPVHKQPLQLTKHADTHKPRVFKRIRHFLSSKIRNRPKENL